EARPFRLQITCLNDKAVFRFPWSGGVLRCLKVPDRVLRERVPGLDLAHDGNLDLFRAIVEALGDFSQRFIRRIGLQGNCRHDEDWQRAQNGEDNKYLAVDGLAERIPEHCQEFHRSTPVLSPIAEW